MTRRLQPDQRGESRLVDNEAAGDEVDVLERVQILPRRNGHVALNRAGEGVTIDRNALAACGERVGGEIAGLVGTTNVVVAVGVLSAGLCGDVVPSGTGSSQPLEGSPSSSMNPGVQLNTSQAP